MNLSALSKVTGHICSIFYVVLANSAEFGLCADTMILSTQIEEWISKRKIYIILLE
jgi:hypothetical protein